MHDNLRDEIVDALWLGSLNAPPLLNRDTAEKAADIALAVISNWTAKEPGGE
jgi:hypothetical protein